MTSTSMSAINDDRLMARLKQELTGDEEQMFCMSFRVYIQHVRKQDFVVDLEDALPWLGFSNKSNAKASMHKYLKDGVDFKTSSGLATDGKSAGPVQGGWNKDRTMMTVEGFKHLCMMANTDKGRRCRDYFIRMEGISMALVDELAQEKITELEKRNELMAKALIADKERAERDRDILQKALDVKSEDMRKKLSRRYDKSHKGQFTYIYKDNDDPTSLMHNVGQTNDMKRREKEYNTHNRTGHMAYTRSCLNHKVIEKLVHLMLDEYRVIRGREWFNARFDLVKDILDTAQLFADTFVGRCEHMFSSGKSAQIRAILMSAIEATKDNEPTSSAGPSQSVAPSAGPKPPRVVKPKAPVEPAEPPVEEAPVLPVEEAPVLPVEEALATPSAGPAEPEEIAVSRYNNDDIIKPLDFERFIEERCEVGQDLFARAGELNGCHRLWGRNYTEPVRSAFIKFLNERFTPFKVNDAATRSKLLCYRGVQVKPPPPIEVTCDIDQFVVDRCRVDYNGKTPCAELMNMFVAWTRVNGDPEYCCEGDEATRFKDRMHELFVKSTDGIYGVTLNTDAPGVECMNLNPNKRKPVTAFDVVTRRVTQTFESLTACASYFGAKLGNISIDIKLARPRHNMILTYDPSSVPALAEDSVPVDPMDFQRFIDECCDVGPDVRSFGAEIAARHRIWAKCSDLAARNGFKRFLKQTFKNTKELDPITGGMLLTYVGIRVRPPPAIEVTCDVDQFVVDQCRVEWIGRSANRVLQDAFVAWKRRNGDPDYEMCAVEKNRIHRALSRNFFASIAYTNKPVDGFYGLVLKDDTDAVGMKLNTKNRKPVVAIDLDTKRVVETYDSLALCTFALGANINSVCSQIKHGMPRGNILYMYQSDYGEVPSASTVKGSTGEHVPKAHLTARDLPLGVSFACNRRGHQTYRPNVRHNRVAYDLGVYEDVHYARAMYLAAKSAIDIEKNGGPKADLSKEALLRAMNFA